MNERDLYPYYKKGLQEEWPGGEYFHPPDSGAKKKQDIRKPYDVHYVQNGKLMIFEVKLVKAEREKFAFTDVQDHQVESLIRYRRNLIPAYVSVHWWVPNKYHKVYFIEIYDFIHWREMHGRNQVEWGIFEAEVDSHIMFASDVVNKTINFKNSFMLG